MIRLLRPRYKKKKVFIPSPPHCSTPDEPLQKEAEEDLPEEEEEEDEPLPLAAGQEDDEPLAAAHEDEEEEAEEDDADVPEDAPAVYDVMVSVRR